MNLKPSRPGSFPMARARPQQAALEAWRLGPLSCRHEPLGTSEEPTLAGHLHPGYRLRAARKSSFYGPVFWRRGQELVLPAFGSLTGTLAVRPGPGDALFLVAEGAVHPLPGG